MAIRKPMKDISADTIINIVQISKVTNYLLTFFLSFFMVFRTVTLRTKSHEI